MSITRWYEIICNNCGCAQHFLGNIVLAEKQFRSFGGIKTKDKKHYCDKKCKESYNDRRHLEERQSRKPPPNIESLSLSIQSTESNLKIK